MAAVKADVRGRVIEPPIRRRSGQSKRNLHGERAVFTRQHGRTAYRGSVRNRSAKAAKGHPLAGLWQSLPGMRRSSRPSVRAYANAQMAGFPAGLVWDEIAGTDL
jgi:hypothetical protein